MRTHFKEFVTKIRNGTAADGNTVTVTSLVLPFLISSDLILQPDFGMQNTSTGASSSELSPLYNPFSTTKSLISVQDQRLLAAAREDNVDLLLEIFDKEDFDINFQDGFVWSCRC